MVGIIGGSGVYDIDWLEFAWESVEKNKYGEAIAKTGKLDDKEVVFIARHGMGHSLMPSAINYRANIRAMRDLGVTDIVATYAVGGIDPRFLPGDFAIPDQFIDFTWGRESTFFDRENEVVHTDMTEPYSRKLQGMIKRVLGSMHERFYDDQVYICTPGPRFETTAEIRAFRALGATLVGMTGVPEVALSRELGMSFASIAVITNLAAGVSPFPLSHEEVLEIFSQRIKVLSSVLKEVARKANDDPTIIQGATPING